jgi:hypothetical protein
MNLHESTLIWPSVWAKCARIWWVLPVNGSAKSREKLWSEDVKVANTVKPCQARHVRGHLSKNSGVVSSFSLQKCTDFYTEVATKHWQTMTNDDKLSPNISHHFPMSRRRVCAAIPSAPSATRARLTPSFAITCQHFGQEEGSIHVWAVWAIVDQLFEQSHRKSS